MIQKSSARESPRSVSQVLTGYTSIELHKHLVKVGGRWHLIFEDHEVKNSKVLEFILPQRTVELLEWYLQKHRRDLVDGETAALFPGRNGQTKRGNTLARQIPKLVRDYTGLTVNVHLFRQIAAKLYLDVRPGGYEVMRRVLGHKKLSTTTNELCVNLGDAWLQAAR